jgi:hypothetical protein
MAEKTDSKVSFSALDIVTGTIKPTNNPEIQTLQVRKRILIAPRSSYYERKV